MEPYLPKRLTAEVPGEPKSLPHNIIMGRALRPSLRFYAQCGRVCAFELSLGIFPIIVYKKSEKRAKNLRLRKNALTLHAERHAPLPNRKKR